METRSGAESFVLRKAPFCGKLLFEKSLSFADSSILRKAPFRGKVGFCLKSASVQKASFCGKLHFAERSIAWAAFYCGKLMFAKSPNLYESASCGNLFLREAFFRREALFCRKLLFVLGSFDLKIDFPPSSVSTVCVKIKFDLLMVLSLSTKSPAGSPTAAFA